jgi:hypothetical protein
VKSESQITFEGQKADEKILMLGRKHPFVLSKMGMVFLVIALVVVGLFLKLGMSTIPSIAFLLFLFIGGFFFLRAYFIFLNSIFILTNQRIVSMDQNGFFSRRVSESPLDKIVNVTYEVRGPVRTILDYGKIIIQTSGAGSASSVIKLADIPNPDEVQRKIASAAKDYADTEVEIDLGKK